MRAADTNVRTAGRIQIADAVDADRFVADLAATMRDLEAVLGDETRHLAAGRIREGLADGARKAELAAAYLCGLEAAKANAVALARHAPAGVAALRAAQPRLAAAVARNGAVLETVRAVSEGLVRSLATERAQLSRPKTYGGAPAAGRAGASGAMPLVFSARL